MNSRRGSGNEISMMIMMQKANMFYQKKENKSIIDRIIIIIYSISPELIFLHSNRKKGNVTLYVRMQVLHGLLKAGIHFP